MKNNTEQQKEYFDIIYYSEIGLCGCGNPKDVKKFLYKLLQNQHDYKEDLITYDDMVKNRKQIFNETDSDVIFEFVFHILEKNKILEHGFSVYSSYLTDKGKIFLEYLSQMFHKDN